MKILKTKGQAMRYCKKLLKKKTRFIEGMDDVLFDEAYDNRAHFVFAKGVMLDNKIISISNVTCNLYIIYNPYVVYFMGCAIATCLTDTINQVVIFVDDDYVQLSDVTKTFVKYHEIGHLVHRHTATPGIRHIEYEIEADLYAKDFSDTMTGLTELYEVTKNKEIQERLKVVLGKSNAITER